MSAARHIPVLLREVIEVLAPRDGGVYVDATFGAGGYSRAILEAADCTVWGIDRDPEAIARADALARRYEGRLRLVHGRFGEMAELLSARGVTAADGVAFDFGVSSMQLDEAGRGFSFRFDGPLDMRMEKSGPSAADLVNALSERELADVIHALGEERKARAIARAIVVARAAAPIERTLQLAEIVRRAVRARGHEPIDPATRTFQALRIQVNDELGEIERGLAAAEALLAAGGRLAVVAFHSLEDRRVKEFLRARSGRAPAGSRHLPPAAAGRRPSFRLLDGGVITPGADEIAVNPRSRSARLRAAERTEAPAWGQAA
ncbi:MAG: ribosomal RNA small subunit methyltransferase H [Alphaproteobacteria bacterium]|nr:MAG: ribosomal RNA small subunit methyltransferase H [Alphaproteobacteria bacterium]